MDDADLLAKIAERLDSGGAAARATVGETAGSTPQKPGAKMAGLPNGSVIGTVGGGCVEGEVRSACLDALLRTREARLIEVSLTDLVDPLDTPCRQHRSHLRRRRGILHDDIARIEPVRQPALEHRAAHLAGTDEKQLPIQKVFHREVFP